MRRLCLVLALAACGTEATAPPATERSGNLQADQIMYDFQHNMTAAGVRKALLAGDSAYVREGNAQIDVMGVRLTFFAENGSKSGDLTSRTAEYDLRSGSMIARGNAVLNTLGGVGRKVESEELHFDLKGDRIWSDKPTVMRQGASVVQGTSFRSDTKFQNVSVSSATSSGPPPPGVAPGSGSASSSGGIRF